VTHSRPFFRVLSRHLTPETRPLEHGQDRSFSWTFPEKEGYFPVFVSPFLSLSEILFFIPANC
jgi:hypothetical protein